MIRDEYSEEVGDLWDAFSAALKRQGRDWINVATTAQISPGGLLGLNYSNPYLRRAHMMNAPLAAQQYAMMTERTNIMAYAEVRQPTPLFGGLLGTLI